MSSKTKPVPLKEQGWYAPPAPIIDSFATLWVISDTHFFHERLHTVLAPGVRPPDNHDLMVQRWNETVARDDVVLHLGDVAVGINPDDYEARLPHLHGQIYLLPGNHDQSKRKLAAYQRMGWTLIEPFALSYRGWSVHFTHEPLPIERLPAEAINVHGHIHHNPPPGNRYINCSVEQLQYRPVRLRALIDGKIDALRG
jgi:calcineurin-like phosphoesterase family protein